MCKKSIIVTNISDVYDNPIAEMVQLACKYSSEIFIESGSFHINAKSIMGVMALSMNNGLSEGSMIDIVVKNGDDGEEAISAMECFLTNK